MTRQAKNPDEKIKYLVASRDGDFIIEIPASYKVTFGYVNPSKSSDSYARNEGHALRVWEGEKLRAVFGNVTGVRDMSIPLARKIKRETGSASWTMDSEGNFESSKKVEVDQRLILEAADEEELPF